jgi:superfamily II DNA or RNA helicase/HKD family nuclease
MDMNSLFITNSATKKLKKRLAELIGSSQELKFLVGFFYFSGIKELYKALKDRDDLIIKVLVGLNVDKGIHGLVEYSDEDYDSLSGYEKIGLFIKSIEKSINSKEFDNRDFYEQVQFFIKLIENNKLIIRKTQNPNHAKLYFFKLKEGQIKPSIFVTGSSNLTKSGLSTQDEFNVEISDYGTTEAEEYFDNLWSESQQITEDDEFRERLIDTIKNKTLITEPTPFEAFIYVLKNYIETQQHKEIRPYLLDILSKSGYKTFSYQLDAVKQALSVIDEMNGVLIADVVGLGKSVIASMIAKSLNKRGIIVCPPTLIGDKQKKSGWKMYKEDFQLYDWEIYSSGQLENLEEYLRDKDDFEVIIVDEAHRFRNQDTQDYELLHNICRNRTVILLTATPFNNSPGDIFSMLKLFIVPGRSKITLDNDLESKFREYRTTFDRLSYIKKFHNSSDIKKVNKAKTYYRALFGEDVIDLKKVLQRARYLANTIRSVIEPVTIRRNRLDLKKDPVYSKEIKELPTVKDPEELFYVLNKEQSKFYDEVINSYFGDEGRFKGAIYRPYFYEQERDEELSGEENIEKISQDNLYEFMRRLIVKRFESSFGAFKQSIQNFKSITLKIQQFISNTKGNYILDRKLLEKIYEWDEDDIEQALVEYSEKLIEGNQPKSHKVYDINTFKYKDEFLSHINSDLNLYTELLEKLNKLDLVLNDPKKDSLINAIRKEIPKNSESGEPHRKIIIFSEYVDTVKYLRPILEKEFPNKVISVEGKLPASKIDAILTNYDASYKKQNDDYDILLSSDKISEGFNLNRAGAIINYDIPWNPVRVIQRVGRINRISKKVFNNLYIYNFFPTEQGASINKSREIASNKMFMIHNTLGEDAKIFDVDEQPTPASLFNAIQRNPEEGEEESFQTKIRRLYYSIKDDYSDVIKKISTFPPRIKVSKKDGNESLLVFIKKGRNFFVRGISDKDRGVQDLSFNDTFSLIECKPDTSSLPLSESFWDNYEAIRSHKQARQVATSETSIEVKARNLLKFLSNGQMPELQNILPFLRMLLEDLLEYKTLPEHTLRRIAGWEKKRNKPKELVKEIDSLKAILGDNYLYKTKETLRKYEREIIIAIENRA